MNTVRAERSGWRDLALSQRHRSWGWDCPCIDIDFLFLEYDKGHPTAIVEYKHERAQALSLFHPTYRALVDLGNRASLPVFSCRYAADFAWWHPRAMNSWATRWMSGEGVPLTESGWVRLLYNMRGYELPAELFAERLELFI